MKNTLKILLLLVMVAAISGCFGLKIVKEDEGEAAPAEPTVVHFEDVLVPQDISLDRDNSFVFETGGFKAGTLFFKGYVEPDSLADFFRDTMPKQGWVLKSIFRHPKTMLLFDKVEPEAKSCVIIIYEKTVYTYVEIWLAPQV